MDDPKTRVDTNIRRLNHVKVVWSRWCHPILLRGHFTVSIREVRTPCVQIFAFFVTYP
jgi:hypothetical protein